MVRILTIRQLERAERVDIINAVVEPINLIASILHAISPRLCAKFFTHTDPDYVYVELGIRLPLSESRFERDGKKIMIYRDDENDRRITSIIYRLHSSGIWVPWSGGCHLFWEETTNFDIMEVPAVANLVLRTMIKERIWTQSDTAIWRMDAFERPVVGFTGEDALAKLNLEDKDESGDEELEYEETEDSGDSEDSEAGESEFWASGDEDMVEGDEEDEEDDAVMESDEEAVMERTDSVLSGRTIELAFRPKP